MAVPTSRRLETDTTASRKAEHIRINVEEDVSAKGISSGFEIYRFVHCALPEIDLAAVDTSTVLFGYRLSAPVLISCMTGGVPEAERINIALAQVAQERRLALGLGSARVLLETPEVLSTFAVREYAPQVPLLANLGAVQLNKGVGPDQCRRIVDLLTADALVLHLNPLQEALQIEGDTDFSGLLVKIERLCHKLDVPVIVKEIGWGIAPDLVLRLMDCGVAAVDVAGAGGTSWSEVERHRLNTRMRAGVAAAFADWGIPTAEVVREARRVAPDALLFASGGIRTGVDVAKAIALGADMVGIAGPFLRAAAESEEAVHQLAEQLVEVLRITMFAVGALDLDHLQNTPRLVSLEGNRLITSQERLSYSTSRGRDFIDITDDVAGVVRRSGATEGIVHVSSHHTTAAIRINENEPLLIEDFRAMLERIAPEGDYGHNDLDRRVSAEPDEPQNGHSHCQHLLLSSGESVPLTGGRLELGAWQRIFLIELDSARQRHVTVQVIAH